MLIEEVVKRLEEICSFTDQGWTMFGEEKQFIHDNLPKLLNTYRRQAEVIKEMIEALKFYAERESWQLRYDFEDKEFTRIDEDSGQKARQALEQVERMEG